MASVSENNWLGRGIKLKSSLNLSEKTISGSLDITNPNYQFSGNSIFGSLDVASTDQTSTSGYESSRTGITAGTEFQQYENIYISPSLHWMSRSGRYMVEDKKAKQSSKSSLFSFFFYFHAGALI